MNIISKEIELKIKINSIKYNEIFEYSKKCKRNIITQINHYFDTEDFFFHNNGITLRYREKENGIVFTMKENVRVTAGFKESIERTIPVCKKSLNKQLKLGIIDKEIFDHFEHLINIPVRSNRKKIKYLGYLETIRTSFYPIENCPPIELDLNNFLSQTDYEIEWELKENKVAESIKKWLNNHQIAYQLVPQMGKYSRFLQAYTQRRELYDIPPN